jgi:hypothetical protein
VREELGEDQRVMGLEVTLKRPLQLGELCAQAALSQLGQQLRVARALKHRLEHLPA